MGSGSLIESGGSSTNSSAESLDGFNFGKISFAAAATAGASMGTASKSGAGSSSSSGSGRKGRASGMLQGAQPPRCQVEGCKVDLSDAKAYYSRHKVCCMHSKSSKVLVAGLEQRFCQQCSRFHQLSEFDKGKRSCRRRLAGHNERRRKPPSGSLFSSPYGNFVLDFSAYPGRSGFQGWPTGSSSECIPGHRNTATERLFHIHGKTTPTILLKAFSCKARRTGLVYPALRFLRENASRGLVTQAVLSLLSNRTWGSRNQASSFGVSGVISTEGSSAAQPTPPHGVIVNPYSNTSWGFNSNGSARSSHEIPPHVDSGRSSDPVNCQFSSSLDLSQQSQTPYSELEQSGVPYDDSMHHIHWSL
ncbi:Detected protein of unknown function [Hibiscus syriacus]|uniref:SBP-type domain-containing protein n=1 Tax=Hibiscus syriacus TaxID=106335 RepID=A0A6A2ZM32_HIBSY|nr:Detected protein of unknown function [Hibiscus syriacus]